MKLYEVSRTVTFYWKVNADSKKDAIEKAMNIGESKVDSVKYTKEKAKQINRTI